MVIRRMFYVACDICGRPAGGSDDMAYDAHAALKNARHLDFRRVKRGGRMVDLCRGCRDVSPS
jgi:hypothetical protein